MSAFDEAVENAAGQIDFYCKFVGRAEALAFFNALRDSQAPIGIGQPEALPATEFPKDGWFKGVYFNLDVVFNTGAVWIPTGKMIEGPRGHVPEYALEPGFHINGRWCGPRNLFPVELRPYIVTPENPVCKFG